jgi:formylglycine-generating enzyme required for sulfatase activity
LALEQQFQAIGGTMNAAGAQPACLTQATVAGKELTVAAKVVRKGQEINILCRGTVEGDTVRGVQQWQDGSDVTSSPWTAKRESVDPFGRWQVRPQSRKDLEGTLAIDPRGGDAGPTYVPAGGGKELALPAFYLWGSSIRFEVPSQGKPVIFTGVLDADAARGTFCKQGWPQDLAWSARRVGDRKTLPPAVPAGVYPPGRAPAAPVPVPEAAPSAAGPSSAAPLRPSASPPRRTMPTAAESPPMTPAAPPASPRPIQPRRWNPAMGEPQPGDEHVNAKDGSVLVWIPGGTFLMGGDADNDEQPVHPVKVDGFWLGKFEVTNRQYAQFLAEQPYGTQAPFLWDDPRYHGPDQPAVGVTMMDAAAYCRWAGLQLPTEAQWEYAAAGGGQLKYPTANGEISHDLANIQGTDGRDQWEFTSPVGSFPPNPFGLYDMAGNAWEWTSSKFAPYPYSPTDGREDPTIKAVRVLRGGCWHFPSDYCRTAYRHRFHDHLQYEYGGFRIMMPGKSK